MTDKQRQDDAVRFNLYLPQEAYEALVKLQKMTRKKSLAETVRSALKLYRVVQEGRQAGKDVVLMDKEGKDKERIIES